MSGFEEFERLRALAAKEPLEALGQWLASVKDIDPPRRTHEVEDLRAEAMRLQNWAKLAPSFDEAVWNKAYQRAQTRLDKLQGQAEVYWSGEREEQDAFRAALGADNWPVADVPSENELRDLRRMEEHTRSWTGIEFTEWLLKGHERLKLGTSSAHVAFAPLRLFDGGGEAEQLAAAFTVAEEADLRWPKRLHTAIVDYLKASPARQHSPASLQGDAVLWRVLSLLPSGTDAVAIARIYLKPLRQRDALREDATREVVTQVAKAVAAKRPYSGDQISFFQSLSLTALWLPEFTELVLECWLARVDNPVWLLDADLSPLQGWVDLLEDFKGKFNKFLSDVEEPLLDRAMAFLGLSPDNYASYQARAAALLGLVPKTAEKWCDPGLLEAKPLEAFSHLFGALKR